MHGNILKQRFNYFSIKPYRDYCELKDKDFLSASQNIDLDLNGVTEFTLFGNNDYEKKYRGVLGTRIDLPPVNHKSRNRVYFTSNTNNWDSGSLQPYFKDKSSYHTTNIRHLKNHYNKPFSEVTTTIIERTITLTENFLSIRINRYTKYRGLNSRYFKKNQRSSGIKIDFKTGNITSYDNNGNRRNKISKIRRNSFIFFNEVLKELVDTSSHLIVKQGRHEKDLWDKIDTEFDNKVFLNTLYRTLCSIMDIQDYSDKIGEEVNSKLISEMILRLFVKLKKIKTPNEYTNYLVNWYPTQEYLKKNDNKLIAAILDRLNLKTKSFIKLFHDNPNINIKNLVTLSMIFGQNDLKKYIPNLDKRYYIESPSLTRNNLDNTYPSNRVNSYDYELTSQEKSKMVKLLNSVFHGVHTEQLSNNVVDEQMRQIVDHILMINKIRKYVPTIELRCSHIKDFHHEHIEYSKIERSIQKGYNIEYTFENRLIDHIEEVIHSPRGFWADHPSGSHYTPLEEEKFYPVVLKNDGEYTEEGSHMHHCVASYADRETSLIISIRQGDVYGKERVTCEFNTRTKELVQAKYFCNAKPPKEFEHALEKIIHRIEMYRGSIQSTGKRKIPLVIDGFEIPIEEKKDTFAFLIDQINQF